jgi:hypothetical protein
LPDGWKGDFDVYKAEREKRREEKERDRDRVTDKAEDKENETSLNSKDKEEKENLAMNIAGVMLEKIKGDKELHSAVDAEKPHDNREKDRDGWTFQDGEWIDSRELLDESLSASLPSNANKIL